MGTVLATISDIDAARAGDAEALQRVLCASRQNLRRYAEYHCVINDAEDAVQESLILAFRRIGSLRVVESFTSWMFRIVKRECNRMKRGMRMLTGDALTEEIQPLTPFEPVELRQDIAAALRSLPAHYRQILLLRDVEGHSLEELAGQLGLSREAAKSRLHRARLLARQYLGSAATPDLRPRTAS